MRPLNKAGFTIIETMLFLGISALLIMGILVGTGTSLNVQRYRDSVKSLQSFLQQQYFEVANVINDNQTNKCTLTSPDVARGQSNCIVLGRLIKTDDGKILEIKNILGNIPPSTIATDDVGVFGEYGIYVSPTVSNTEYEIEWGSSVVKTTRPNETMSFSILILRSPLSGITRTFIDNEQAILDSTIRDLLTITPSALEQEAKLCVDSGGLFTGSKMAVNVNANATGASSIETLGDDSGCL